MLPNGPNRALQPRVGECGALVTWWAELAASYRGQDPKRPSTWRIGLLTHAQWRFDPLWEAAAYEAAGRDEEAAGFPLIAEKSRQRAARIILDARKRRSHDN